MMMARMSFYQLYVIRKMFVFKKKHSCLFVWLLSMF